jgi:hypothetical protein
VPGSPYNLFNQLRLCWSGFCTTHLVESFPLLWCQMCQVQVLLPRFPVHIRPIRYWGRILPEGEPRDICRTWGLAFFRGLSLFTATFFIVIEGDDSRGIGQVRPEYHSLGNFPR